MYMEQLAQNMQCAVFIQHKTALFGKTVMVPILK